MMLENKSNNVQKINSTVDNLSNMDFILIWDKTKLELKNDFKSIIWNSWIGPLRFISYENNICTNEIKQVWEQSKLLKKAEEYRLIYVAITRAKNLLWMSAAQKGPSYWRNIKEKVFLQNKAPCLIFSALMNKFPHLVVRH